MLIVPLAFAVALTQQTQSFTVSLHASVAEATPLFGPVREAEWAPEWRPRFVHPEAGAQREGVVFTTTTPKGFEQLWMVTEYDEDAGRVGYVIVTPGFTVNQITIRIVSDGPHRSKATITYRRSALVERANDEVAHLDAHWAAAQGPHWESAINAVLDRLSGRRD